MKQLTTLALLIMVIAANAQRTVHIDDYGAIGNGIANDGVAIQKAFDSGADTVIATAGKKYMSAQYLYLPSNTYLLCRDTNDRAEFRLFSYVTKKQQGVIGFRQRTLYQNDNTSFKIYRGQKTQKWSGSKYLVNGKVLWARGADKAGVFSGNTYAYGTYGVIASHTDTSFTLRDTAAHNYTANFIRMSEPTKNVGIDGIFISTAGRETGFGIYAQTGIDILIQNCVVEGDIRNLAGNKQGISMVGYNILCQYNYVYNTSPANTQSGTAYAYACAGMHITCLNNRGYNNESGFSAGSRDFECQNIEYGYNHMDAGNGNAHQYDFHGNAQGRAHHNYVYTKNGYGGFTIRNSNIRIDHNDIVWDNRSANADGGVIFIFEHAQYNISIDSNTATVLGGTSDKNMFVVSSSGTYYDMIAPKIYGNTFKGGGIAFNARTKTAAIIERNTFSGTKEAPSPHITIKTSTTPIKYRIRYNTIENIQATGFCYNIKTPDGPTATTGLIEYNTIYCPSTQTSALIRLHNSGNTVRYNKIVSSRSSISATVIYAVGKLSNSVYSNTPNTVSKPYGFFLKNRNKSKAKPHHKK